MELWSALVLGLLGSFHCLGMCGPIVMSLPINTGTPRAQFILCRLTYNGGRILTYMLMGGLVGWIGQRAALAGYQQVLSLIAGGAILLMVLLPTKLANKLLPYGAFASVTAKLRNFWGQRFQKAGSSSLFAIGLINGLLPCGLVYVALAASATGKTSFNGALYMLFFGLGTLPIMMVTAFLGRYIGMSFRRFVNRLIPVAGVIIALLFILRGLSLGIPYLSPNINLDHSQKPAVECCHPEPGK